MEGEINGHRQTVYAHLQHCGATKKLLNKKSQVAKVEVLWRLEAAASCSCHSEDLLNLSRSIPTYANMTCTELHRTFTGFRLSESAESPIVLQIGAFAKRRLRQHSLKMQWQLWKDIAVNLISHQYDENTENNSHETAEHCCRPMGFG